MSVNSSISYVRQLEVLILQDLLPVYERWHKEHKLPVSYTHIHPDLLKEIKDKQKIPALLRKYD